MQQVSNGARSPLRYPGGKAKISKFVAEVVRNNNLTSTYIEPFAGGAGVAVNLLLSRRVDQIIINDLDDGVYSFWKTVVTDPGFLVDCIKEVPFDFNDSTLLITPEARNDYWVQVKKRYERNEYRDFREKARDFFLLNRMNVSGIINGGPIGGRAQAGRYTIASRFNKSTLIQRIEDLYPLASRIKTTNFEASHFLQLLASGRICDTTNALLFVDPPYYVQGRNLYACYATDYIHSRVASRLLDLDAAWILTYDVAEQINSLYPNDQVQKYIYQIQYSANKRGKYGEYMFASPDLELQSFDNVALEPLDSVEFS